MRRGEAEGGRERFGQRAQSLERLQFQGHIAREHVQVGDQRVCGRQGHAGLRTAMHGGRVGEQDCGPVAARRNHRGGGRIDATAEDLQGQAGQMEREPEHGREGCDS